jgi:autotransporter-associated beta strand protein
VFNDKSGNRNITINDMVVTKGVTFDFNTGTYNLSGNGGISGSGDVVKNGKGEVVVDLKNSDYTGKTIINEGTLTITNIDNSGRPSALGASNDVDGIQLAGGTLKINATNMSTDRVINLVSDTSTINVFKQGGSLSLKSITKGNGYLVKDGMGQLNFTYGGANTFPGIIVKRGVVAQGAWNATFCKTGGNMTLAGGEVHLINMNNSSTRPIFNYVTEVQEGTKSLVKGTTRGAINGSFKGKGELTIISDGVRNDIGANFSAFEGTLNVQGANFRLQSNVTDMSKTNVVMTAGSFIGHYQSNGSSQQAVTTSFGSLSSAAGANDCTLGHSQDSYTIGHNGMSTSFSGLFKAKSIQKVGAGVLTLRTSGSTSPIYVNGGTLQLYNEPFISAPGAVTSASITVNSGAELTGIGCAYSIVVNKGGLLSAGYNGNVGTLKANGNVILNDGGTIQVKIGASSNDKFKIKGSIKHNGDTLLIVVDEARTLKAGDKITIFDGAGTQSGTYVLKTISPAQDITWDDSELLTTGVLKVASAETSGISGVITDDTEVNVYTTDGMLIRSKVKYGKALEGLQRGVYLINGRKVVK